jgi:hypothetical protein
MPYTRFFNYEEECAAEIDWDTAKVFEKADGSLITLYHYDGKWQIATSGMPDANGPVNNIIDISFAELFMKIWEELGYKLPDDPYLCFMFELMTPYNKVIVQHKESKILLHGCRDVRTLREYNPIVIANQYGWECVPHYSLSNWDEIVEATKALDPIESEGFVVCNENWNRVKVKSPQYVALSHMKEGFSVRRMLQLIQANEGSEFLSYFPEYEKLYHEVRYKYTYLLGECTGYYNAIKHIDDRKEFALLAKDQKFSAVLFGCKFGKVESPKAGIETMDVKYLERILDIKNMEL